MALSPTMEFLKFCGNCCAVIAVMNVWFWFGMTVFSAMGNTYLSYQFEGYPLGEENPDKNFTQIFGIILLVSIITGQSNSAAITQSSCLFVTTQINILTLDMMTKLCTFIYS